MSFFSKHYHEIRYPVAEADNPGLRTAQLGAIHAVAAHFTLRSEEPAIVVMPTGAGKTAVLAMVPFVRRCERTLVVTTRRLVRNQIAEDLSGLETLRALGVIPDSVPQPRILELEGRIGSRREWNKLKKYDVVVATPNSVSPALEGIPPPPVELFDLLLIDEAHHTATRTWNELLEAFHGAEKAFFTATPYRRDKKEVRGRFVYDYPLKAAFEEKIFGKIEYVAVKPRRNESNDVAVARKTQAVFRKDEKAGLKHYVMVRTDSKNRANELRKIYEEHTDLNLQMVHSGHTYGHVKRSLRKLTDGKLDGIICVDMMSEGFDCPNLKIAAIHAPHRSLEVTLQFIGRFARTNAEHIGEAKFLAVPSDIEVEQTRLYKHGAVWQDIIVSLSSSRMGQERMVREAIEAFSAPTVTNPVTEDISLYSLTPFCHVKVYRVAEGGEVSFGEEIELSGRYEIEFWQPSLKLSTVVFIAKETEHQRWTKDAAFSRTEYDLFVVYFDKKSRLLFINASRTKSVGLYEEIASHFTGGEHKILPTCTINRVMRGLEDADVFNVGMKNRLISSNSESYRILTGKRVQKVINKSDGRSHRRGHLLATGKREGESITIGYSSASKVWSLRNVQIPILVKWCQHLAQLLCDSRTVESAGGLRYLPVGETIEQFPDSVVGVDWGVEVFRGRYQATYSKAGKSVTCPLTDFDLEVDLAACTRDEIRFAVLGDGLTVPLSFQLKAKKYIEPVGRVPQVVLTQGRYEATLIDFLNNSLPNFYDAEFAVITGEEIFRASSEFQPFETNDVVVPDWSGVAIQKEFWKKGERRKGKKSIHQLLEEYLNRDEVEVLLYDHGTGEIADFVTLGRTGAGAIRIGFYHAKKSGGKDPGNRVDDVYEVCGQIVKSVPWIGDERKLYVKIEHRVERVGSRLVKGDLDLVEKLLVDRTAPVEYTIAVVQPGISRSGLDAKLGENLASAQDHIKRAGGARMLVIASE